MRRNTLALLFAFTAVVPGALSVNAQSIISAKAGLIHLAEGDVLWNGEALQADGDRFVTMKEGDTLATTDGRAEVLLNPGTLLRMTEDSSFQLIKATFTETELRLVSGTAMIEVDDLDKENSLRIEVEGHPIRLVKRGLYEFQAGGAGAVRVYDGEVLVPALDKQETKVKEGREMAFNELEPRKFDKEITTALYRWSARRARTLASIADEASRSSFSRPTTSFSNNTWLFSSLCGCYYYYIPGGMYSPFASVIYVRPVYIAYPSYSGFSTPGPSSYGNVSAAAASSPVDTGGGAALPAAAAAPVESSNSAGRRR